jgi:hypothetical protein
MKIEPVVLGGNFKNLKTQNLMLSILSPKKMGTRRILGLGTGESKIK